MRRSRLCCAGILMSTLVGQAVVCQEAAWELVGVSVTPHVRALSMRFRRSSGPLFLQRGRVGAYPSGPARACPRVHAGNLLRPQAPHLARQPGVAAADQ